MPPSILHPRYLTPTLVAALLPGSLSESLTGSAKFTAPSLFPVPPSPSRDAVCGKSLVSTG